MKNNLFLLLVMLSLFLPGCQTCTESTDIPSVAGTTEAAMVPPTTQPLHSDMYLSQYSQEQILTWFEEVVLDMEYSEGEGDITLVQKWTSPIGFRIYGKPTREDLAVLNDLIARLNQIPGFPGFYTAEAEGLEALQIRFLDEDTFRDSFSGVVNGEDAYGATQFWYYTQTNEIHSAQIGCRTDISQNERNSVLVEEIVNALGLSDTLLREDSITYQYSNDNTDLSQADWILLKLLYHSEIRCGMNRDQCAEVIRQLYSG